MHFRFIDRDDNDDAAITPARPGAISIADRSRPISARSRIIARNVAIINATVALPLALCHFSPPLSPSPRPSVLLYPFLSLYLFPFTLYLIPFGYLSISLSIPPSFALFLRAVSFRISLVALRMRFHEFLARGSAFNFIPNAALSITLQIRAENSLAETRKNFLPSIRSPRRKKRSHAAIACWSSKQID